MIDNNNINITETESIIEQPTEKTPVTYEIPLSGTLITEDETLYKFYLSCARAGKFAHVIALLLQKAAYNEIDLYGTSNNLEHKIDRLMGVISRLCYISSQTSQGLSSTNNSLGKTVKIVSESNKKIDEAKVLINQQEDTIKELFNRVTETGTTRAAFAQLIQDAMKDEDKDSEENVEIVVNE